MSEPDFEERRQYKRIRKHFILTYYDIKKPGQKFSATQLKNISRGGLCLVTDQSFEPGAILAIEIKQPLEFSEVLSPAVKHARPEYIRKATLLLKQWLVV